MAQEDKNVTIPPEMMQEIVRVASETAIEKFQHEAERNRKAVKDKRLHNTKLLLQNYHCFVEHSKSAVYEASQLSEDDDFEELMEELMSQSDGRVRVPVVRSIQESAAHTRIIVQHIDRMLEYYKFRCEHARFEKVEKVPSNDEAQDNVLYLVMNAATGYYDIYAKVGEEVVRLDDTTVDLSNYATIDQLNAVSGGIGGTAYAGTKEDLSASDDSVIAAYFKAHTDVAVKKGDVFVVTTTVGNSTYEKSAYFYNGKAWVAMTGNVDADKVILRENITLAGGYTQVGNLTKSQNGTATFATKGKSVMDALTEIFSKRLQPSITAQPSIGTFTLTGAGAVEAGTKVAAAAYSGATLNAGSYQYGPATGVTATNWKVERITNAATTQVTTADAASLTAGSDNNGGAGFIIGDAGDNAVSSLKYRVTATHGAGVTAKDNLGADSSPVVAIAAGSKTKDTAAYTPFRNVFYGTSADKPALDSAAIRALGKTGKAYAASTLTINVPVGAQRVAIACIATAKGVTKVINETAMNADVTSTFAKSTVSVEGANGYAAKDYNVWVFEPAVAYGNAAVLKVTLG